MTSPIGSTSSTTSVNQTHPSFGPNVTLMGPDDIMAYVTNALGDIGDQLDSFKKQVEAKQAKAQDLRDIAGTMRLMNTGADLSHFDGAAYNEMMTKMSHHLDDKNVKAAYDHLMESYGGFQSTDPGGGTVGVMAGADGKWHGNGVGDTQDCLLNSTEVQKCIKDIEGAQSALGSENELTMMSLQQLMQRRNQVTQFSSNCLNVMNEGSKSVIGNIR